MIIFLPVIIMAVSLSVAMISATMADKYLAAQKQHSRWYKFWVVMIMIFASMALIGPALCSCLP